jgi:hypothetical protein
MNDVELLPRFQSDIAKRGAEGEEVGIQSNPLLALRGSSCIRGVH